MKSNYRKEMTIKLTSQTFMEEFSLQNCTTSDDFSVDDLLDFSHVEEEPEQQQQQKEHEDTACVSLQQNPSNEPSTFKDQYVSVPTSDLSVPVIFFFFFKKKFYAFCVGSLTKVAIFTGG